MISNIVSFLSIHFPFLSLCPYVSLIRIHCPENVFPISLPWTDTREGTTDNDIYILQRKILVSRTSLIQYRSTTDNQTPVSTDLQMSGYLERKTKSKLP